ncbi:heavy metal sensor histidine kinase [Glaciimonas immobilis]|uniref:Sensor protein n=1 Tax=Glaciimonas immobilis TaxID=728004 RepID=A0A840S1D2_9BURK|nr:heavy metal sensor histidine kinase [Glaciimonas immobilis]KAF3996666.1 heavy metal sensor histidine kinase [Glaciimonas immobilis]MBB5202511.1 two-component system heavy metal sensor histidine kinase CusS [Glaciimonas immobilis]
MKRSITVRLVTMFAAAALLTFSLIGASLYSVVSSELQRHQQEELHTIFQDMQYMIDHNGTVERWPRVQAKLDTLTPTDGSRRYWILSDDTRFQFGKGLAEIDSLQRDRDGLGTMQLRKREYPLLTMTKTISAFEQRPPVRLIVGIDSEPYYHTLHAFVIALISLSLAGVALVMLLGYWIAKVSLRPLKQLSNEAQILSPKALSQRLQVARLPDELSDLATTFNGALDRIENAYTQLEGFNADVAHELRTPLANLIGETQVALSRERSAVEFQEVLQSNLEDLERVRSIINDMLFLARADQGTHATGLIVASIALQVSKTVEFFEFILDDSDMRVSIVGDVTVEAPIETALFRRAMSNLLQNAIQHSSADAQIIINITQETDQIKVAVSNPGDPIHDSHLNRLFDRFYRVDAARHDRGEQHGFGLGLAIVRAVANMHGGSVFSSSVDGMTTIGFSVRTAAATILL